jgi:hypothetical protein
MNFSSMKQSSSVTAQWLKAAPRITVVAMCGLVFGAACATSTDGTMLDPGVLTAGTGGSGGTAGSAGAQPAAGSSGSPVGGSGGTTGTAGSGGKGGTTAGGSAGAGGTSGGAGGTAGGTAGAGGGGGAGGAGGAGGTGGTAGAAGSGGSGGAGSGYRYVKLVALSEQAGAVWSCVAELQLKTTGGAVLPQTGWTAEADSEETDDEQAPASAAIDGDTATFWHTAWEPAPNDTNDAKLPHELRVDLGAAHPLTGFSYVPRQTGTHGRIKDWEFYVSNDGSAWGTAVKSGSFADGTATQDVTF